MAVASAADQGETPKTGFVNFLRQHPVGFWFIFWGEFAERCSYYGMRAILALYMADQLGFGDANAATFYSLFIAACYFLPLVGGYLADNYFGKYRIIVAFSIPYILGHFVLGVEEPLFLFLALGLLAMGSGVIKPNISTLMGLTYDQQRPGQEQLRSTAFAMFYMAINIGAAISMFALPLIRDAHGYRVAFLFPALLMALAFVIFAAGKPFYAVEVISRKKTEPEEFMLRWQILGRIGLLFLLVLFFWAVFDQSSSTWVFFARTYMDCELFGWRIPPDLMQSWNPVLIVLLLPFVTWLWTALDRRGIKVRATDKILLGFLLTMVCMGVMAIPGLLAGPVEKTVALRTFKKDEIRTEERIHQDRAREAYYDLVVAQVAQLYGVAETQALQKKLDELRLLPNAQQALYRRQALPTLAASTVGLLAAPVPEAAVMAPVLAATSSAPQRTQVDYVRPENRVTVWWQVLAYLVLTIAEILISVTGLELAFTAAPNTMKSFVTSLWLLTVFLANVLNAVMVRLYPVMNPGMYFLMFTSIMLVVTALFVLVARQFNRRMAEAAAVVGTFSPQPSPDGEGRPASEYIQAAGDGIRAGPPPDTGIQERRTY